MSLIPVSLIPVRARFAHWILVGVTNRGSIFRCDQRRDWCSIWRSLCSVV